MNSHSSIDCGPMARLLKAAGLGGLLACGMAAYGQRNIDYANAVVTAYGAATCGPTTCSSSPPVNRAQVAPDRFVMQGATAIQLVNQQFSTVTWRLRERLAAAPLVSATSARAVAMQAWSTSALAFNAGSGVGAWPGEPFPLLSQAAPSTPEPQAPPLLQSRFGMYFRVEHGNSEFDPTAYDRGFEVGATSFTLGGDFMLRPDVLVGLAYTHDTATSDLDTGDGGQPGSLETRGDSLLVYGAYYPSVHTFFDATLTFGRNRYSNLRKFAFVAPWLADGVLQDTTTADTEGSQYGLNVGGGYNFMRGPATYGPYARLSYAHVKVDGFTEDGGEVKNEIGLSNNLRVSAQSFSSLVSTIGLQASYAHSTSWGVVVPNAFIEWAHQFQDALTPALNGASRESASAASMTMRTTPVDRDFFTLGAGVAAHLGVGRSALLHVQTDLGRSGQKAYTLAAELRLEF